MLLIAEVLYQLQIEVFESSESFKQPLEDLQKFRKMIEAEECYRDWKHFEEKLQDFVHPFKEFVAQRSAESLTFKYWNVFIQDIVQVLVD